MATDGTEGRLESSTPDISGDGRYVTFSSAAPNLVEGDTNSEPDIFLRDRSRNVLERLSVGSDGSQANGPSLGPVISADGRYVAFVSAAGNILPGTSDPPFAFSYNVYVRDHLLQTTILVSQSTDGTPTVGLEPAISGNGRYVAFWSNSPQLVTGKIDQLWDVFVRDLMTQTTRRIACGDATLANDWEHQWHARPSLDYEGDRLVFQCLRLSAPLPPQLFLVEGDGEVKAISVSTAGDLGNRSSSRPALSADGTVVSFESLADNFASNDTNDSPDVFVRDLEESRTDRVSVASDGSEASSDLYFATLSLIPSLAPASQRPDISASGRFIAFASAASNLTEDDTNLEWDIFVHDRLSGVTVRSSVSTGRQQANGPSDFPVLSADGRTIAYHSHASNLVPQDRNAQRDVFVQHPASPTCTNGHTEEGAVSGPVHEIVEPDTPAVGEDIHRLNCDVISTAGL
jgi:Tol biopolymer transport system component